MNNTNVKKGKFNAIDFFVILVALACLFTIVYRAVVVDENAVNARLDEYIIHFKIDSIRSSALDYLKSGDTLRIKSSNKVLGKLEGIDQHLAAVGAYNENGGKVFYPMLENLSIYNDTRYTVSGYITVRGEMTENGFLLNGDTYTASNMVYEIISEHIETTIRIIDITEK